MVSKKRAILRVQPQTPAQATLNRQSLSDIKVPHALTVGVLMALSFVNHPFFLPLLGMIGNIQHQ
jgi:hypothetical protein